MSDVNLMHSGAALMGARLLFIGPYPPPYGGIASLLKPLMPALSHAGADDIAVITFGRENSVSRVDEAALYRFNIKKNLWKVFIPKNLPVIYFVCKKLMLRSLPLPMFFSEIVKSILICEVAKSHDSKIVFAYQANINLQLIPLNAYWSGSKSILLTVFGELYELASEGFMYQHKNLFKDLLSIPIRVMASSRHCANSFRKIGVSREIDVIFVGVEIWEPAPLDERILLRKSLDIDVETVLIFFMGRMVKDMGLDVVISTANTLLSNEVKASILIAGASGDLSPEAQALKGKYPNRVFVFENISFEIQRDFYKIADILVAPSFNQRACMGVSIKEAMAAGLPVVGGAGGGISEAVIDGETGFLIPVTPSGSVDGGKYLGALRKLVNDRSLRQRFGDAGRKRAEDFFSVRSTNMRYIEIIQEINEFDKN